MTEVTVIQKLTVCLIFVTAFLNLNVPTGTLFVRCSISFLTVCIFHARQFLKRLKADVAIVRMFESFSFQQSAAKPLCSLESTTSPADVTSTNSLRTFP